MEHIDEPRSELATQYAEFIRLHQSQLRQLVSLERSLNLAHANIARMTDEMDNLATRISSVLPAATYRGYN